MIAKSDWRVINYTEMQKMTHRDRTRQNELTDQWNALAASGQRPVIRYREFHGFDIRPADDPPPGFRRGNPEDG